MTMPSLTIASFWPATPISGDAIIDGHAVLPFAGQRHAFLARYRAGFDCSGRVHALEVDLYSAAGNSLDLSVSIMDRALLHSDCAYKVRPGLAWFLFYG